MKGFRFYAELPDNLPRCPGSTLKEDVEYQMLIGTFGIPIHCMALVLDAKGKPILGEHGFHKTVATRVLLTTSGWDPDVSVSFTNPAHIKKRCLRIPDWWAANLHPKLYKFCEDYKR